MTDLTKSIEHSDQIEPPSLKPNLRFVGITYSKADRKYFHTEEEFISEDEVYERATVIAKYLEKRGIVVKLYAGDETIVAELLRDRPDLVINLVDTIRGEGTLEPCIPAALELAQIPYTGSGILGLSIGSNKYLTKKLLDLAHVPTPKYQFVVSPNDAIDPEFKYPLISKLNQTHGSVGMTADAVSSNEAELRKRLRSLIGTYKQPVLIEEFVGTREVSVILLDGLRKKVYCGEKVFDAEYLKGSKYTFCTFDGTWLDEKSWTYKKYDDPKLNEAVRAAFDILKMDDYAKFDIRLNDDGSFYFIDCNPNSTFGPKEMGIAMGSILDLYGINFDEILDRLLANSAQDIIEEQREAEMTYARNMQSAVSKVTALAIVPQT